MTAKEARAMQDMPAAGPGAGARDAATEARLGAAYAAWSASGEPPRTERLTASGAPAYANRLLLERSPYLRQHAFNPVDWRPWGAAAFAAAEEAGKPIFLSVGYATCHWCHVMEHESFDDEEVAEALNRGFIAIKVDREELPDVDQVYMTAALFVTRRGGWPNSVWLTANGRPFFAGSYFPKAHFLRVLGAVSDAWTARRGEVLAQADELSKAIRGFQRQGEGQAALGRPTAEAAVSQLAGAFNAAEGGFGQTTQFPNEPILLFLLDAWRREGMAPARQMAVYTLAALEAGGVHDQIGGGFHRYAVDANWRTPHFEKMLYNQGLMLSALAEAAALPGAGGDSGAARLTRAAHRLIGYALGEMRAADGAFYAAEDADSLDDAGRLEEGAFYVWDAARVAAALGADAAAATAALGLDAAPTLEHGAVAHLPRGRAVDFPALDGWTARLKAARSRRARPLRDEKVIAAWNGLMIRALAEAAGPLNAPHALDAAVKAADAVWTRLWRGDALYRLDVDGAYAGAAPLARLDDLAWLGLALLSTSDALWDAGRPRAEVDRFRARAALLADLIIARHQDASGRLAVAPEEGPLGHVFETDDGATPAAESSALELFARLDRAQEDPRFASAARRLLAAISRRMSERPSERPIALVGARVLDEGESRPWRTIGRGAARARLREAGDGAATLELDIAPGWRVDGLALTLDGEPVAPGFNLSLLARVEVGEARLLRLSAQFCEGERCLAPSVETFRVG